MTRNRLIVGIALIAFSAGACKKSPPPQAAVPLEQPPAAVPAATTPPSTPPAAAAVDSDAARLEAERIRGVLEARVFFDYDVSGLREDARQTLDAKLPLLRSDPSIRLRIEGHADERGSTEYNLALSNRRAESVAQYLVDFGIERSRLQILSYGEERPLTPGERESAWSQNRRAEFVVTAGSAVSPNQQ